jgi:CubicO group peptidase (beta-lactamase class C family)
MHARRFASHLFTLSLFAVLTFAPAYAHETAKKHAHAAQVTESGGITLAKPESVGLSTEGLKKMEAGLQTYIDKQQLAGLVTLAARHGEVVEYKAYGYQDLASKTPMRLDTIVRIFSMTKPIAGTAMMMLYEEGKWKPSDPIAKYIPEFANLKVYAGDDKDGKPMYVAPNHPPTIGELMSHNAGFTYGLFGQSPVDKQYQAANPLGQPSLQAFIDTMAKLPLLYQPGEKWVYSVSVDIQGYLVQKLSGKTFPDFLRERIFEPLGMKDTGFFVPEEKLSRVSTIYSWNPQSNSLAAQPRDPNITKMPGLPSGGGGLYSTAADYFRWAQMIANSGELNGVRLLKPSTVALMRTNKLNDVTLNSKSGIGFARFVLGAGISPAQGFGYDFAVVQDPAALKTPAGKGSFWWWGIANTWFWIDPTNDTVFIGLIQRQNGTADYEMQSRAAFYDALTHPEN